MTFSVIIPVYNVAPYLTACLDSVFAAAKGFSVEVICTDDGSTDGSGELLDGYVEKVEKSGGSGQRRLKVLHQPNCGVATARNRGLELAAGDWLLFVDSDDVVRDTIFSDLTSLFARHGEDDLFGYGQVLVEGCESRPPWGDGQQSGEVRYGLESALPDICTALGAYRFAYRRDRYGDIRFPLYARGEDLVYVARVLARAPALVFLSREEYGYRNRAGSAVHAELTPAIVRETVRFQVEMFGILADSGKDLSSRSWQMRLEQWILRLPIAMEGHGEDPDWKAVWNEWRRSMSAAVRFPFVTGTCRFVARLAILCPLCPILTLAGRIGIRLKRRSRKNTF